MKLSSSILLVALCVFTTQAATTDGGWRRRITPPAPGNFPALPSIRMDFSFGWSDLVRAAEAQAELVEQDGVWVAKVNGRSLGPARALWKMDARHEARVAAGSLLPIEAFQDETYRRRTVKTRLRFDRDGVHRFREVSNSKTPAKWKRVSFPSIRDVISGVLFVRSLPLKDGDRVALVCFPGDSPYFVVAQVEGRERIRSMGRERPAIRIGLQIRKLEVEDNEPTRAVDYAKFRNGTVWVSDDELRLPLRAEVRIFIGFVYGELTGYELLGVPSSTR